MTAYDTGLNTDLFICHASAYALVSEPGPYARLRDYGWGF